MRIVALIFVKIAMLVGSGTVEGASYRPERLCQWLHRSATNTRLYLYTVCMPIFRFCWLRDGIKTCQINTKMIVVANAAYRFRTRACRRRPARSLAARCARTTRASTFARRAKCSSTPTSRNSIPSKAWMAGMCMPGLRISIKV